MFKGFIIAFIGLLGFSATAQLSELKKDFVFVKGSSDTIPVYNPDFFGSEEDTLPEYLVDELKDFYISKTCVSIADYKKYCEYTLKKMPDAPKWGWGDESKPMTNISYKDAEAYAEWIGSEYNVKVRLPHQTEWVFAANGGDFVDPVYFDTVYDDVTTTAVFKDNAGNAPKCVSCGKANSLGLHNMLGNVWEWADGWFYNANDDAPETDEEKHMIVGGSYLSPKEDMFYQKALMIPESTQQKDIGFRLAISKVDYEQAELLEELNAIRVKIWKKDNIVFSLKGIEFLDVDKVFLWNDELSFEQVNSVVVIANTGGSGSLPYSEEFADDVLKMNKYFTTYLINFLDEQKVE